MGSSQSKRERRNLAANISFGSRLENDCIKAAIAANKQQRKLLAKQAKQANIQPSTLMFRNNINPMAQDQLCYQSLATPSLLSLHQLHNNTNSSDNFLNTDDYDYEYRQSHYLNEEELDGKREIFDRFEPQHQLQLQPQHHRQYQQLATSENYPPLSNDRETYYIPGNGSIDKRYVSHHNLLASRYINEELGVEEGEDQYYLQPISYTSRSHLNHHSHSHNHNHPKLKGVRQQQRLKGSVSNSKRNKNNNKRKMFPSHAVLVEPNGGSPAADHSDSDVSTIHTQGALKSQAHFLSSENPDKHYQYLEQKQQQQQQLQQHQQQQDNIKHQQSMVGNPAAHETANYSTNKLEMMPISSKYQRGLAFTEDERKKLGLQGHLPAAYQDQDLQVNAVMNYINTCQDELSKYVYLRNLKDFNEHLFYSALMKNVEKLMPLVYTPTVGLACQKFSHIYMKPRGLFITANNVGKVDSILANWPEKDVRVIVVTDGERILGLGDLGANGMGISIGKLSLYTALAGIPPQNVLPITIDVGTNNEFNLKDPFYIGLRQNRIRGERYDLLIDEFMKAVVTRWGKSCLIQFEDFANSTAFNLLQRYRNEYCTFNDDIQGTASVCLSGLISATKLINRRMTDCSFLFYGAGEANLGTANLVIMAMMEEGASSEQAKKRIFLIDSKGLVVKSRTDLSHHKAAFAQDGRQIKDLEEIIDHVKPVAIIGASAQGKAFTMSICRKMASFNDRPIIFALSNPTSKAECTAEEAYRWTEGRCVFASGSPFDPVVYNGKTYITGQGNNAYIFPGVGLAAIAANVHTIPEEAFLVAARALSDQLTTSDTSVGLVYPKLTKIREVTLAVATKVLEYFYAQRLATYRPEPDDKVSFLKSIQYDSSYEPLLPEQKSALNQMSLNNNGRLNGN